jgi:hypothetical protein
MKKIGDNVATTTAIATSIVKLVFDRGAVFLNKGGSTNFYKYPST